MSGFYVLDVPEFASLVKAARAVAQCRVHEERAGYFFVEIDGEIEISRDEAGLNDAVWFGCLTGGLDAKIVQFDANHIRLAPTNEPILPV